ncbi:MAG: NIPSNAP family protein [Verrucomicrobiota bacterium]
MLTEMATFGAIQSMRRIACTFFSILTIALVLSGCATAEKNKSSASVYELRTYFAAPGKLDALHARFRDHTMKLFAKHGMENIGYFVPLENSENKLVYLLAYPSRDAREVSWKAFLDDPDWKSAAAQSETNGKLVDRVEQIFLQTTDFSPALKKGNVSHGGIFELRTYTTPEGSLPDLDHRFRVHTMKLFASHGMKNWVYFHKTPDQPAATTTLVYFLAHQSQEAAQKSFDEFRKDPVWMAVKSASEKNGSLTVKDGVKSVFLKPTDYSPTK